MIKFLFIQKDNENVGVEYLSSSLKSAGHLVELVFFQYPFGDALENKIILKKLTEYKPDIVCCSPFSYQYRWSLAKVSFVKKKFPKIFTLFGGVHVNSVPEVVIKEKVIDGIIIGEAEKIIVEFANNFAKEDVSNTPSLWYKKGKEIKKNQLAPLETNLDSLPFPDKGLFYLSSPGLKYLSYTAIGSRGCPYACSYCYNSIYQRMYQGQKRFRQHSPEYVIKELVINKKKYGFSRIEFADDVLAVDIPRLKKLMGLYSKKIKLPFGCFFHPNLVKEETVKLLKKGGCTWFKLGVQSANEQYRKKYLHRHETNENILQVAKLCHKHGLQFSFDHILNLPGETKEHLIEAVTFYNKCRPTIISFWGLMYLPATEIIQYGFQAGVISKKDVSKINQGDFSSLEIVPWRDSEDNSINMSAFMLLFVLISLLPEKAIDFLVKARFYDVPFKIPNIVLVPLKILAKIRAGQFYLYKSSIITFFIGKFQKFRTQMSLFN